ncbi:MAG: hypothetical protein OJF51_003253 [Nitrospira sp.]|nr:MAG: hypothetical protein OJF51_003253 [Nitrospira sp.]
MLSCPYNVMSSYREQKEWLKWGRRRIVNGLPTTPLHSPVDDLVQ